jgi:uncharacterized phiE125 gp8 family phage protein
VTLTEVKSHLRVTGSDDDTMLNTLIQAAREYAEMFTNRALVTQTWKMYLQDWPCGDEFEIPYPPLQSVASIKYTDSDDTQTTWNASYYEVDADAEPGRVIIAYGETWPSVTLHPKNPIEVEFISGYDGGGASPEDLTANIPENIKNAIKLDVELRYDRPSESYLEKLKNVRDMMLTPYKVWTL